MLKKWLIVIGMSIVGIFVILATTIFFISLKYEPILTERIKKVVFQGSNGLYTISFKHIRTNMLMGNLVIKNVKLIPNWKRYHELSKMQKAPDNVYEVSMESLKINGFHPRIFYNEKILKIQGVELNNPHIIMTHEPLAYNKNKEFKAQKSPFESIKAYVNKVIVDRVVLKDAAIQYKEQIDTTKNVTIKGIHISLFQYLLDKQSEKDTSRFYNFEDAVFHLPNYEAVSKNKLYKTTLKNCSLMYKERQITIGSWILMPTLAIDAFQKKLGFKAPSIKTNLNQIEFKQIDIFQFLKNRKLVVRQLSVADGSVEIINGKNIVNKNSIKSKVIPQMLLQKIPLAFSVAKADLHKIQMSYEEFNIKSGQLGLLIFNNSEFKFENLCNIKEYTAKNPILTSEVKSELMGSAKLQIQMKMDYASEKGHFTMDGTVGSINGRLFNKITVPMGLLMFRSLNAESLGFNLEGDDDEVHGNMLFKYSDLNVILLKKNEESGLIERKGLLSLMTNNLVLNPNNPTNEGKLITAPIHFKREASYSFSKYIWKALLGGFKYSVGLTPDKEAQMKYKINQFKTLKEKFQDFKESRLERRKNRIIQQDNQK